MSLGNSTLKLSNSLKAVQDPYTMKFTNYSVSATLNMSGKLDYRNYYPITPTFKLRGNEDEECCGESDLIETKPWDLSMAFSYSKNTETGYYSAGLHNTLHLNLTKNWGLTYTNYYNIKEKELISQSVDVFRDLNCWQLTFRWNKSGDYWSYRLEIKVKNLPDLRFLQTDSKSYY